jgi:hypothetical protein
VAWSRPALAAAQTPVLLRPEVARATVLNAGDGIAALDARTGEPVGAISGIAPAFLAVDASLSVAAIDAEGHAAGYRLATHLSVV